MINLIYKDIKLTMDKRVLLLLGAGLIFSVAFQQRFSSAVADIIGATTIAYTISLYPSGYDAAGGNIMISSLPLKKWEIVASRYIASIIFIIVAYILVFSVTACIKLFSNKIITGYAGLDVLAWTFAIFSILSSISYPINYRFGKQASSIISSTLFFLMIAGPNLLVNYIGNNPNSSISKGITNLLINGAKINSCNVFVVTFVIYILSMFISISILNNRDLIV